MTDSTSGHAASPRSAAWVAGVGLLWQGIVIALAFRYAPSVGKLATELGTTLPASSTWFLASYRWWALVPVACALQLTLSIRRRSLGGATAAAVCALAAGLFLQAWTIEAVLAPVRALIDKLG